MRVSRFRWIKKKDSSEAYFRRLMRSQTLLSKAMITSYRSLGLLHVTSFLALATFSQASTSVAAEKGLQSRQVRGTTSHQQQVSPRNRLRAPQVSASFSFATSSGSQQFDPPVRPVKRGENPVYSDMEAVEVEAVEQAGDYLSEPDFRFLFAGGS